MARVRDCKPQRERAGTQAQPHVEESQFLARPIQVPRLAASISNNMESVARARTNPGTARVRMQKPGNEQGDKDGVKMGEVEAHRIAGYIYAYTESRPGTGRFFLQQQTSDDPLTSPKSPFDAQPAYKGKRMTVVDHSAEDRWQTKLRAAIKEMNALDGDISQGKSDKLELERDLHTYEYIFAKAVGVYSRLNEVLTTTDRIPIVFTVSEKISSEAHSLYLRIKANLETLQTKGKEESPVRIRRSLGLRMRPANTSHHLKTCFRGAYMVSCRTCIIHVLANKALMDLRITALTPDADKLELHIKQKAVSEVDALKYIKTCVLPKLYLKWDKSGEIQLAMDEDLGRKFTTLYIKLQGTTRPGLVLIKEDFGDAIFSVPSIESHLSVSLDKLTPEASLLSLPFPDLKRLISTHLLIQNGERLLWCGEGVQGVGFTLKEKGSKMLDPDYLSERLHDFVQVLMAKEEVLVDGQLYTIELYAHKSVEKLRITHRDHPEEIGADSSLLHLVRGLQFSLLQRGVKTMLCSLELTLAIRALFSHKLIGSHSMPHVAIR